MDNLWLKLYSEAKEKINAHEVSPFIESGNNACCILGGNNKIYSGISIYSTSEIKSTAERSAITSMFNDAEFKIKRMVILNELEEIIPPTETCIDYLLQLCEDPSKLEILINLEPQEVKTLKELIPDWWGTYRNKKN